MGMYSIDTQMGGTEQNLTTTLKTLALVSAATATLKRHKIMEFAFGASGLPNATDCAIVYVVRRSSGSIGTGTTATPSPFDPADVASGAVCRINLTAEPMTPGVDLLSFALNQRASQRWACTPGQELVVPAVDLNAVEITAKSTTYTSTATATIIHQDQ